MNRFSRHIHCWTRVSWAWAMLGIFALAGEDARAQAPAPPQTPPAADPDATAPTSGPALRRIFFYEAQAPRLVPNNFWPVRIDDLEAALAREQQTPQPGEEEPQLVSAVYVARFEDGALVSDPDASIFDLAYRDDAPGLLSLGAMNLAIQAQGTPVARAQSARLLTAADGTVHAVVNRDCRLRFGWSRRGVASADGGYEFELRIPPCGRTRILVGLPEWTSLRAIDGVLTALPSPPQEARGTTGETELSWYAIEAGGLPRVRLGVRDVTPLEDQSRAIVLRKQGLDYLASATGIDWTARVAIDVPKGRALPALDVSNGGRITAVRVDNVQVRWTETTVDGRSRIRISASTASTSPRDFTSTIEVSGTAGPRWGVAADGGGDGADDPNTPLPWVSVAEPEPLVACAQAEFLLRVADPLRLVEIGETAEWRVENSSPDGAAGGRVYRFAGPPTQRPPATRFAVAEPTVQALAALRLALYPEELLASWEVLVELGPDNLRPLRFELQPGWRIDSISIRSSRRIVETQGEAAAIRHFTIWPEPADVVGGVMGIQITGHRAMVAEGEVDHLPASWFVRLEDSVVRCYAAVDPPAEYEWGAATALRGRRVKADQLPTTIAEMIGPVSADTLLFDTDYGMIPELSLDRPPAAFNSDLRVDLHLEGEIVVETVRVRFRVPAGRLPSVRIQLGESLGRPPMRWSLDEPRGAESLSGVSLDARRIREDTGGGEDWELVPSGGIRDALVLVGQRRYPASRLGDSPWNMPLPTVPVSPSAQATTHRAIVSLGPRVRLLGTHGDVLRIPNQAVASAVGSGFAASGDAASGDGGNAGLVATESADHAIQWLLRYDASEQASLDLAIAGPSAPPLVVWEQRVEIMAGVGGDQIRALFYLDARQPLDLRFDPAMSITTVDGMIREDAGSEAGHIQIAPRDTARHVAVEFWRPRRQAGIVDRFLAPTIQPDAIVLRQQWRVWAAGDAILVDACESVPPPEWMTTEATSLSLGIAADQQVWVIPSTVGWAVAGAVAILCFGAVWWLSPRAPWLVTAGMVAAGLSAVLMPVWSAAVLGFVMVPCAAAGLLGSALDPTRRRPGERTTPDGGSTASRAKGGVGARSSSGSLAPGAATTSMLVLAVWAWSSVGTRAADDERAAGASTTVPVLIPLTTDGELAGDRAYIPKSLYESLFRSATSRDEVGQVYFDSSDYQMRVIPSGAPGTPDTVLIEALWRVEIESTARQIRLPVAPEALDRLEVVVDSVPNEIRTQPDGSSVLVRPPRTGVNIFRAILSPDVELTPSGASRVELAVPPAARATLALTSDASLRNAIIPVCFGQVTRFESGTQLTAALGPVPELELIWQRGGVAVGKASGAIQRRWWIHASHSRVSRELELDLGEGLPLGAVVELASAMDESPTVTSPEWALSDADAAEDRWRMVATVDSPGPIRLLWSESEVDPTADSISISDVRPVEHQGPVETCIGVDLPDGWSIQDWSLVPAAAASGGTGSAAAVLEPAEFASLWRGYRGAVDVARRYTGAMAMSLRLAANTPPPPSAAELHRVTVTENHLRVHYRAVIQSASNGGEPMTLQLPPMIQLESVIVDGQSAPSMPRAVATDGVAEILLPRFSTTDTALVEAEGIIALGPSRQFAPPRLGIAGLETTSSRYEIVRTDGLRVREISAPSGVEPWIGGADYDLTSGTVPLRSWELSRDLDSTGARLDGRYEVNPVFAQFRSSSLTTLRWEDGLWTMNVVFDIENFGGPSDFLTFEVPSRWIDGLDVNPAAKWSIQPSTDPTTHLIRVLPRTTSADRLAAQSNGPNRPGGSLRVRITSTLVNAGEGGVAVPDIRLLGAGVRRKYFATPRRLTSNPIVWQTQYARPADLPARFAEVAPDASTHTVYEVVGDSFSATLQPAEIGDDMARASAMEIALFPRDQRSCVALIRLLLLPGDRQSVTFQMPEHSEVLGAWSSGTAVQAAPDAAGRVSIPVGLSRLAQQMAMLVILPTDANDEALPLPTLVELPVAETWLVCYDESRGPLNKPVKGESADDRWARATPLQHQRALAAAVMDVLDASVDNVAERPSAEKRFWLRPWFARLEDLGWVERGADPADAGGMNDGRQADPPSLDGAVAAAASPLPRLDAWIPKFLQRVFGSDASTRITIGTQSSGHWLIAPPSFHLATLVHASGAADQVPMSLVPRQSTTMARWSAWAAALAVGGIVWLVLAISMLVLRPRWSIRPAAWLFILGLLSLAFAPLPVSVAMVLLALTGPWLAR